MQEAADRGAAELVRGTGIPDQPRAWLTAAARRKAIDIVRRETGARRQGAGGSDPDGPARPRPDQPDDSVLDDDLLRLIFTCCHPSLAPEARLALALRTLCQLSVAQVAAVMLTSEAAMAKRLTRTRQKIAVAKIPYRVPADAELPERLAPGLRGGARPLHRGACAAGRRRWCSDVDVCAEGLRLARLLHELLPDEAMPAAVLALVLLTEARRPTRVDADGTAVLLPDQDRAGWDRSMITEGLELLDRSLRRTAGVADPYQLQAAIAAEHARAPAYPATDWTEIVRLYDLLVLGGGAGAHPRGSAGPGRGPRRTRRRRPRGLQALDPLPPSPRWHAVRAGLPGPRPGGPTEAVEPRLDRSLTGELTGAGAAAPGAAAAANGLERAARGFAAARGAGVPAGGPDRGDHGLAQQGQGRLLVLLRQPDGRTTWR